VSDFGRSLDEPFPQSPLVLLNEHAAELAEPVGTVFECAQNSLAVVDRQRDDPPLRSERVLDGLRDQLELGFAQEAHENDDGLIAHWGPGQHQRHADDHTPSTEQVFV
jgi:hypothetical protein